MNQFIQNLMGMGGMTDQIIATDFLISVKSAIRNLAAIIAETTTSELREELRIQLKDAIDAHTLISAYMIDKGFYLPNDLGGQLGIDLEAVQTASALFGKQQ
ncbi:spore coat protein [Bacillus sp. B-jedd]|uniref:spore coat protein n=1 Tax=Bacillus sp. B-jedd TaxID=1476857 RepID=UPI0005156BD2|nr:spore coat protein [Bacillus sp. B-jedd]CEG27360.1 YraD protein [Bacillus sp. B-jedd]